MKYSNKIILFFNLLNICLLIIYFYHLFSIYPILPENIPTHFKMNFEPDRHGLKINEIYKSVILLSINGLLYLIIFLFPVLKKYPGLINIPNKKQFLQLSLEKQNIYWQILKELFTGIAVIINFIFLNILYGTIRISYGEIHNLDPLTMVFLLTFLQIFVIFYIFRIIRLPRKLLTF